MDIVNQLQAEAWDFDYSGSLTVGEIAKFMNKPDLFVREAIKNGSLPIGAYTMNKQASFYISPKRAYEYLGYRREKNGSR